MAKMCRDRNGPRLAGQILVYPVTDPEGVKDASRYTSYCVVKQTAMTSFWDNYLPKPEDYQNPYANLMVVRSLILWMI